MCGAGAVAAQQRAHVEVCAQAGLQRDLPLGGLQRQGVLRCSRRTAAAELAGPRVLALAPLDRLRGTGSLGLRLLHSQGVINLTSLATPGLCSILLGLVVSAWRPVAMQVGGRPGGQEC